MSPLRLALVGAGQITANSHLPAALACDTVDVTAIVDPVTDRAAALAREFGINPVIASSVQDVVSHADAALIATPNDSHKAVALMCLEGGLDVLIEKPLAASYEDGRAIVERASALGRMVGVGYVTRFRRNTRLLKTLLDRNYFGRVRRFVHQFGTVGGWAPLSAYNLNRAATGGGVLVVTGTHFLDRMLNIWGYPDEMSLVDDSDGGPEANCVASFVYKRPDHVLEGCARYSKTASLRNGLAIDTEAGVVTLADRDDAEILLRPWDQPALEHAVRQLEANTAPTSGFVHQVEDFARACKTRQSPLVDGQQGLESLRLLEALYQKRRPMSTDWYAMPASGVTS
jgi:predicted dehydrogenase